MNQNNKHISEEDFRRYFDNQMTLSERNLFERELQKHPFEAEALEGFQNINPNQFQKDLNELKNKIYPKKRKNRYTYWAAAASFLLIVTSGLIWFQLNPNSPMPQIAEYKTEQKQKQKFATPDSQQDIISKNEIVQPQQSEEKIQIESKKSEVIYEVVPQAKKSKSVVKSTSKNVTGTTENNRKIIIEDAIETDISLRKLNVEHTKKSAVIRGISQLKDSNVLFGIEDVQNDNNIQPSTSEKVLFKAVQSTKDFSDSFAATTIGEALPEMPSPKSSTKMRVTTVLDSKAQPEIGMQEFKKYLKNEAVLPNDYPKRKEVVKLQLKINTRGEIAEFQKKNNADSLLFEQAKEIIQGGSKWQPEIKNRIPINSEVEIKIIFRKKN